MRTELPELGPDDYKDKDAQFWQEYREILYEQIKEKEREKKLEKTPENIYSKAMEIGIKAAGRYFDIQPSQVRYYIRKVEQAKYMPTHFL